MTSSRALAGQAGLEGFAFATALLAAAGPAIASPDTAWDSSLQKAVLEHRTGNITSSIEALTVLRARARSGQERARAADELGASLSQARRTKEAREALLEAYSTTAGEERAKVAVDLGNLAMREGSIEEAARHYREAIDLFGPRSEGGIVAALNLVRTRPREARLDQLKVLRPEVAGISDIEGRARLELNLGEQARELGAEGAMLAAASMEKAAALATSASGARLRLEALDALAQLYEDNGRAAEARTLTMRALARAGDNFPDLRFGLDWRIARLDSTAGEAGRSLTHYERAVDTLETIRPDIPIEYDDGRSSFRATFEPLYLGLADQLLRRAAAAPAEERASYLWRVRDVIERLKQAEMQDYLGDRCEVEAIHGGVKGALAPGSAVLYPIILADRVELLLQTHEGIELRTTAVPSTTLRRTAREVASALRSHSDYYLGGAQRLYRWLVAPFEHTLDSGHIGLLVVVPDSTLRLVPMGVLHDGHRFLIEKVAVTVVTGLTMVNPDPPPRGPVQSLVAGLAQPGPVIDKLPPATRAAILDSGASRSTERLEERLALPGVTEEVNDLGKMLHGAQLLDAQFTVGAFERQVKSGDYGIVHIASHGVFGASADASYILAYDDLLTLDRLQALLRAERLRRHPIEILSLSACETAEGDDRSPLGISGAAMKARAKAVIGSLWPVEDQAARLMMEGFYGALEKEGQDKAQAMRSAQLALMHMPRFAHPFFWAPFVLIGNWE